MITIEHKLLNKGRKRPKCRSYACRTGNCNNLRDSWSFFCKIFGAHEQGQHPWLIRVVLLISWNGHNSRAGYVRYVRGVGLIAESVWRSWRRVYYESEVGDHKIGIRTVNSYGTGGFETFHISNINPECIRHALKVIPCAVLIEMHMSWQKHDEYLVAYQGVEHLLSHRFGFNQLSACDIPYLNCCPVTSDQINSIRFQTQCVIGRGGETSIIKIHTWHRIYTINSDLT